MNGMTLECATYRYSYAYAPEADRHGAHGFSKVVIDGELYDFRIANSFGPREVAPLEPNLRFPGFSQAVSPLG